MSLVLITLFIAILISAFFSGMELAFFSLREVDVIDMEKVGKKNPKIVLNLLKRKEQLLTTILIGNNLVNFAASALNTVFAVRFANANGYASGPVVVFYTVGLTVLILIFGEMIPKNVAIRFNRQLCVFFAPLMWLVFWSLYPIGWFFNFASLLVNRGLKQVITAEELIAINPDMVLNVVSKGQELGGIDASEKNLIENVFHFTDKNVAQTMISRTEVFVLDQNSRLDDPEITNLLAKKQYSRIPVYEKTVEQITGIVHLKDIFQRLNRDKREVALSALAKAPLYVHESTSILVLFEQLKTKQQHMAIVVDEFGGFSGVITMEDILEELVGEIFDEKDVVHERVLQQGKNHWLIHGQTDLDEFNKKMPKPLPTGQGYETIQGLIMDQLKKIPAINDQTSWQNYRFKVKRMQEKQIQTVEVNLEEADTANLE